MTHHFQSSEHSLFENKIFTLEKRGPFDELCLEVFYFQYHNNPIFKDFCDLVKRNPSNVTKKDDIPFLPIEFFKTQKVISSSTTPKLCFTSSGTTGAQTSRHYVPDPGLYEQSFLKGFEFFFGKPDKYVFLALLPGYLERQGSSLIYMMERLIKESNHPQSGFYLYDMDKLQQKIKELQDSQKKIFLVGVTYALLDMAEGFPIENPDMIVMETGGMKGKRKEMIRQELHQILMDRFGVSQIHSEYGMTELLSQAYSKGEGLFRCPPWMEISTRELNDPFSKNPVGKTGAINIIDLANLYSCSFIATQDLGICFQDGSFRVEGRSDNSDIRGCNLMVS